MAPRGVPVPDPQRRPYNKDRLLSKEGLELIQQWNEMEKKLPADQQTGIDVNLIKTQGQANAYTEAVLSKMRDRPTAQTQPQPQRLPLVQMAGVTLAALAVLALLIFGLVWVAKQISSITLLILVISAGLLFFLILVAVVLLISGHLSEKIAERVFSGVLGKIPGLDKLLPKTSPKD